MIENGLRSGGCESASQFRLLHEVAATSIISSPADEAEAGAILVKSEQTRRSLSAIMGPSSFPPRVLRGIFGILAIAIGLAIIPSPDQYWLVLVA